MKAFILTTIILSIPSFYLGQDTQCDSRLTYKIANRVLKKTDKIFRNSYFIDEETYVYAETKPCEGEYLDYSICCDSILKWDDSKLISKRGKVQTREISGHMDFSCLIVLPNFTDDYRKCTVRLHTHQSEWGGHSEKISFKRIFGIWFLTRRNTYRVS